MTGALVWGVKSSFVEYVEALGEVEVIAPAARDGDGRFRFPAVGAGGGYAGAVAFRAHHGAMDVVLRDPRLDGRGLSMEVDDHGHPQSRMVIAHVDEERAALAASGAVIFDFRYPPGTELAPVLVES
ncbi:hypothetical protein ARHIZOSPH14_28310 [Agromyces rhizosphaerae]|uniref:Htaa domain-containing protein n=1 Tax=Agromyces rhizosphaerae TaxID=88374 RepID=A0A9W6FQ08_9MICO|nr:HtaA domain-containing protein [Agromyces rhizosphaerae]GLI28589.1 hypothetical protein ARHIZOSPH14_28310 [Agromyces rhizosphaerae]